ncbi:A disintegrin and metalloproteinase with thrombospondin motifs 18 isoform X1 [Microplitis demolitor]|uniref:A disintegrin and metalloproteinase with thrombospondin motifs 18 isoform X1 n=1 Tax=Microplitis demolitor TaxID=69319 RepID=UPI0004CD2682|nr:A disintegrin and metalloproteinase with thrombospondin motifs 18 isoform X1 [Microplitis demolitor]
MTRVIFLCAVLGILSQGVHLSEAEVNNARHVTQATLFGDDIKSWLTPYEGILATENTPVYGLVKKPKVSVNDTGYEFIEHKDVMKNVIAYLRENKSDAITTPSTKPPKVHQEQNTVVENKVPERSARQKISDDINQKVYDIIMKNNSKSKIYITIQTTPKPFVPYPSIVYPEILVIVDNALFKKLGSNVRDVVTHILAFWNGVDLLFRNLESPKFRFNIEAILIIEDPDGFTKLEYAPNKIDANELPSTIGKWLYRNKNAFPLDSYDVAVLMTSNYLISRRNETILGGISNSAGACKILHGSKFVAKTTFVTEIGDFYGIRSMAHELGHSFGIVNHDGEGNQGCQTKDGNIMGPTTRNVGSKYYEWSRCSLEDLTQSFIEGNLICLYNEIHKEGAAVPRLLPGKIAGLDKQCDARVANTFSVINEDDCRKYFCRTEENSNGSYEQTEWPVGPADGSSCGQGKMCLLGNCVQENLIH